MSRNGTEKNGRLYKSTHPWITFTLNLEAFDFKTWLLFGEAESKCEHLAGAPLRPEIARQFHEIYLTKGVFGTTSIEGNTLSEAEVLARVQGDLDLPESREYQGVEIDSILEICNDIIGDVVEGNQLALTPDRIKDFNRRLLEGQPLKEEVVPGEFREHSVGVLKYRGAPAEDCEFLIERLCVWLDQMQPPTTNPELRFTFAVLRAMLAHLYIAWIHPFGDGNGRTARLVEFQLLVSAGVPLPAAHLLSDHYNKTREAYYVELDRTSKEPFAVERFIRYAVQGLVDGLRDQIDAIREQQMQVTWENYVHDLFKEEDNTAAGRRRRHLVLDMKQGVTVPARKIPEVSPRLAVEYAGKTAKTISRDVNYLVERGLLRRRAGGLTVNRQAVRAFLPLRAEADA